MQRGTEPRDKIVKINWVAKNGVLLSKQQGHAPLKHRDASPVYHKHGYS